MSSSSTSSSVKPSDTPNDERYRVLVEFAYKHLDFQMAELESTLDMYGMQLDGPDCKIERLPRNDEVDDDDDDVATEESQRPRRPYVILSFPAQEADRLSASNIEVVDKWKKNANVVEPTAGIAEIVLRCTLVKSVVELWGAAGTLDACAESTKDFVQKSTSSSSSSSTSSLGKRFFERESTLEKSWKMTVHTLGAKFTRDEQDAMRKKFSYLGFQGPVQLNEPDNEFIVIREVEMDGKGSSLHPSRKSTDGAMETAAPPTLAVYFGRVLGGAMRSKGRRAGLEQYNLKHRAYLGPTSMDAELSFVMTNFGQVHKGSIVYDPFVGTGSILLSCALRGAYCIGSDIDIRVLKGRSEKENIWTNFDQFNLRRPDITRTDNAIYHRHFRNHKPLYDAIICDPPYGIRAGARKTGSRLDQPRAVLDEHRGDHIAQTKPYPVSDVMSDLLDVAARTLCLGGRLVYVIPSFASFDEATDLPRHECLECVHSCYQPLSVELGRRIVVMKKVSDYDPSKRDKYLETMWVNGKESAEKCANLRDKILEHAKQKPGYEEKAAIRRGKRKATKEAKKKAKAAKQSATP
jgi:tRNA (guanine10-N2)-methyltransferase